MTGSAAPSKGALEIGLPDQQIVDPGETQARRTAADLRPAVVENLDTTRGEHATQLDRRACVMVVVAEHAEDPERRLEARERRRQVGELLHRTGEEVTADEDQVGSLSIKRSTARSSAAG